MNLSINPFTYGATGSSVIDGSASPAAAAISCPSCGGDVVPVETETEWQYCPSCANRLQIRLWPVTRK
ncbi:MAG: hypothetical protein ABSD39_19290, partial [Terriglobales bacterium]